MDAAAGAGTAATPRRRPLIGPETYEMVFGTVYTGLMTNLLLAIACLPLVVLVAATIPPRPGRTSPWPRRCSARR